MKLSVVLVSIMCVLFCMGADECQQNPGRRVAEQAQKRMEVTANQAVPIPEVAYFQEKRTIAKWASRWDKPNLPTYVYLISFGKVLGYYVADGKPSSTRSYLMPEEQMYSTTNGPAVLGAPDIDGTYGDNNPGIRFFTAEGVAVEWAGDGASYLYSDAPIDFGYEVQRLRAGRK